MLIAFIPVFAHSLSTFSDAFLCSLLASFPSSAPSALYHRVYPPLFQWDGLIPGLPPSMWFEVLLPCVCFVSRFTNGSHLEGRDAWGSLPHCPQYLAHHRTPSLNRTHVPAWCRRRQLLALPTSCKRILKQNSWQIMGRQKNVLCKVFLFQVLESPNHALSWC